MELDARNSSCMKNQIPEQVIGIPISSAAYITTKLLPDPSSQYHVTPSNASLNTKQGKVDSLIGRMSKLSEMVENFAHAIREHVRIGFKLTETVNGKLRLAAKILHVGGTKKVLKQKFNINEGEKLLKASQCHLSTTAGPIAGILFITTDKIAFCSERSMKFPTSTGELFSYHYKVMIPLRKIKTANKSENAKKASRKYLQIVTDDNFEFWFMGFLNYQKTFKYIQQALSQPQ